MNEKIFNDISFRLIGYINNIIGLENLLIFNENESDKKRIMKKINIYYDFINKELQPLKEENIDILTAFSFMKGEYGRILKKAMS